VSGQICTGTLKLKTFKNLKTVKKPKNPKTIFLPKKLVFPALPLSEM